MKDFLGTSLLAAALIAASISGSYASEMSVPGIFPTKIASKIKPTTRFPGRLETAQFVSSVDEAQNSWRSAVQREGKGVEIGLKLGDWERPDPQTVDTVWLVNTIDWANINTRGKDIEYSYTFAGSTPGIEAIFKFGATLQSAPSPEGDCSFSLIYGEDACTFRRGEDSTSGNLPFKITEGTTVRIRIKANQSADIWIDDIAILANQVVDLKSNFISIIAKTDYPTVPHLLQISSMQATLVNAE
jgi:hypothetical protein